MRRKSLKRTGQWGSERKTRKRKNEVVSVALREKRVASVLVLLSAYLSSARKEVERRCLCIDE